MIAQSDNRPEAIQSIGNGEYYVNMNIREKSIPSMQEGEEPRTSYEYDYVKTSGYPTYGVVVTALIREQYTESDELAIQRQRESKPESFAEYNDFCEACKAKAKPVFFPEQNM